MTFEHCHKIEAWVGATASGSLQPDGWACDQVLAHGLAGQRNRLGSALDHLLAYPNEVNLWLVTFLLASELERQNICRGRESVDVARDALKYFGDARCPNCGGRGVMDFQQTQCPACQGSGDRPRPSYKPVADALCVIDQAISYMERQLRKKLGRSADSAPEPQYVVNIGRIQGRTISSPSLDDMDDAPRNGRG